MATTLVTTQHILDEVSSYSPEPLYRISSNTSTRRLSSKLETRINIKPILSPESPTEIDIEVGIDEPLLPETQEALEVISKGTYQLTKSRTFPELKSDEELIIQNKAVGLNPIDWKSVDYNFCMPEFPWVNGRECSGVVVKVGAAVRGFKVGDKVWTSTYYRDVRAGCFQEFVTVPQHTVCKISDNLDYASAAMLGVGPLTSAMTLWRWLDVPMHSTKSSSQSSEYVLIWGGSTITGQIAIQLCVQSGLKVIAVASERTAALVTSLGATHVICRDGKTDDQLVEEVISVGQGNITRGLDLVGAKTAALCLRILSSSGKLCVFAPLAFMSSKQEVPANVKVANVEMKQFVLDKTSSRYSERLNWLVKHGHLKLPEKEVLFGGLARVVEGLDRVKKGDMNGKKLVVAF